MCNTVVRAYCLSELMLVPRRWFSSQWHLGVWFFKTILNGMFACFWRCNVRWMINTYRVYTLCNIGLKKVSNRMLRHSLAPYHAAIIFCHHEVLQLDQICKLAYNPFKYCSHLLKTQQQLGINKHTKTSLHVCGKFLEMRALCLGTFGPIYSSIVWGKQLSTTLEETSLSDIQEESKRQVNLYST